jgi:SAM-dependent methyltransferase
MNEPLRQESAKLVQSWMQHDPAWLRDYLVAGVEDPRLNIQSILSRHFLIRSVVGNRFEPLMAHEFRFGTSMQWLSDLVMRNPHPEELESVRHALRRGADNAEGVEIPHDVLRTFAGLPAMACNVQIPNYLDAFLANVAVDRAGGQSALSGLDTFSDLWRAVLFDLRPEVASTSWDAASPHSAELPAQPMSVLEPACGSANDYRFLSAYGISRLLNYTGFDLCPRNIENARSLFPGARFEIGNVFEIEAPDKAFDWCIVHDLFEHLSLEGMETAVREICRVCRRGLCVGFFQMDEVAGHVVRPVDDYHWNMLSRPRLEESFAAQGFRGAAFHIGTFLRQHTGCNRTHNPNAYTFVLHSARG